MSPRNTGIYNKNRCAIFNYIMQNPGHHFSEIMRELGLTKRGLGYHLEKMTDEGIVITQSKGIFKYYYPMGSDIEPKNLTPSQQDVFDTFQETPMTLEKLTAITGRSTSSVKHHLYNLQKNGFVGWRKVGGETEWYVE